MACLECSQNKLKKLPLNIGYLKYLTRLDVRNNRLSTLPKTLEKLNLTFIDITDNFIKSDDLNITKTDLRNWEYVKGKLI